MRRILITGMSATGKSSVIAELARRGYSAVDLDDPAWSEYRDVESGDGGTQQEWLWRDDRVDELLRTDTAEVLFVSGCASNQGQFYGLLDHVVLLSAPVDVMVQRLATRSTNNFGKDPEELARILRDTTEIEPLLRRRATLEVDTSAPLDDVVAAVLRHAGLEPA